MRIRSEAESRFVAKKLQEETTFEAMRVFSRSKTANSRLGSKICLRRRDFLESTFVGVGEVFTLP